MVNVTAKDLAARSDRNFFKRNKVNALEFIVPKFYIEDDIEESGLIEDPLETLLNAQIKTANIISQVLDPDPTTNYPNLNNISGISRFFIKQNNLTNITNFTFERDVLQPLNTTFKNFETSSQYANFLSAILIPNSILNVGSESLRESYLAALGWFHLLNLTPDSNRVFEPSSFVFDKLLTLYNGEELTTLDGINGLTEFIWRNYAVCSVFQNNTLIPANYLSGTEKYTSGTQNLEALKTLNQITYSPLKIDAEDFKVAEAFEDFISLETLLKNKEPNGPLYRFLKAVSFLYQDIDEEINLINDLYDIENCPTNFLTFLANIIGFKLLGPDPERHRLQLRNAVDLYKSRGTKKSLQIAVDSIFGTGAFTLSSLINELYESYIPNMIYYALNTDTLLFSSFDTYTSVQAQSLGVSDYSFTDMDRNKRFVVDHILLRAVQKFPELFFIQNQKFCVGEPDFIFKYRDRIFPIPPWEEEKFYKDSSVTPKLIAFLKDQLVCFGVSQSFVIAFENYLLANINLSITDLQINNSWLFFTSSVVFPPNYEDITNVITETDKILFASLWNTKSSHFDFSLESSSFTFTPLSLKADSSLAFLEALRCIDFYVPAHAIADTKVKLKEEDISQYVQYDCPSIFFEPQDCAAALSSHILTNYEDAGVSTPGDDKFFLRAGQDEIIQGDTYHTNLPRNSLRRKNYQFLLPRGGFFIRNGFSMPGPTYDIVPANINSKGYIPLGYNPSICDFEDIPDFTNLPEVYGECENLSSSSVYFDVSVSDTYPVRGLSALTTSDCTLYTTRGDLDPVVALMHDIFQRRALDDVSSTNANGAMFSLVGSAGTSSKPNVFGDYEDFKFGRGIHQIYDDYTDFFKRHGVSEQLLTSAGGFQIFTQIDGPTFFNGNFNKLGSRGSQLVNDNFPPTKAAGTLEVFSGIGDYGLVSPAIQGGLSKPDGTVQAEPVIVRAFSGVELIIPETSKQSSTKFELYKIAEKFARPESENFAINNGLIKLHTTVGLPRIRLNTSNIGATVPAGIFTEEGTTRLVPEHEYEVNVNFFLGQDNTNIVGGDSIGVWIHTFPESPGNGNFVWSYTPRKKWELLKIGKITENVVKNKLAHKFFVPEQDLTQNQENDFTCFVPGQTLSKFLVNTITSSHFLTFKVPFHTLNRTVLLPEDYFSRNGQLHKSSTIYLVEVFKYPNINKDKYALFNNISIIDKTQVQRRAEFTTKDLLPIFRYFNSLSDGKAAREADTESVKTFYAKGGSRLNYRFSPTFLGAILNGNDQITNLDFSG